MRRHTRPPRHPGAVFHGGAARTVGYVNSILAVTLLSMVLLSGPSVGGTWAYFTNSLPVTSNVFATDTIQPATGVGASQSTANLSVTWTASTSSYAAYDVYHSLTSGSGFTLAGSVAAGVANYSYAVGTSASAWNVPHYFYVRAKTGTFWASSNSSETSATPVDTTAPTSDTTSPANGATIATTSFTASGTASDATSGLSTVQISVKSNADDRYWTGTSWVATEQWLSVTGTASWTKSSSLPSGTSLPDGTYTVRSRATDYAGNVGTPGTGNTFTVAAGPVAPTGLGATANTGPAIGLSWTTVAGVSGYKIYRSTSSGAGFVLTASVTGAGTVTYSDTAVADGVTYYYNVRAEAGSGALGGASNEASATADGTAPTVTDVQPPDDSGNSSPVARNTNVQITFGESMNTSSVESAFCLTDKNTRGCVATDTQVAGSFSWSNGNRTITFDPTSTLASSAQHSLTIRNTATDAAGNALAADFDSEFITTTTSDTTRPYAASHSPTGTDVGRNADLLVSFSEAMAAGAVESAFCLSTTSGCASGQVSGVFVWSSGSDQVTFDPAGLLAATTIYYVQIKGTGSGPGTDVAGNRLCETENTQCTSDPGTDYSFSFTTAANSNPTVVWSSPVEGETGVPRGTNLRITVNFSEAMNQNSVYTGTTGAFCVYIATGTCAADRVAGAGTWTGNTFQFDPSSSLTASTEYYFDVSTAALSSASSTPLANLYRVLFTTAANNNARDGIPQVGGVDTYEFAPGALFDFTDTACAWGNNKTFTVLWDDASQTQIGTGTSNGSGCFSASSVAIPFDATAGAHNIVIRQASPVRTAVVGVTIFYADTMTLVTSETDLAMSPGQTGVTLTATITKDSAAVSNAGVKFVLSSVPTSCAGGALNPASSTIQRTNSSGQVTATLTACSAVFTSMTVQALTGGSVSQTLNFSDPPPDPPSGLVGSEGSIRLAWQPSPSETVSGYKVFVGTQSRIYTQEVDVGNTTAYVFKDGDLPAGVRYYITLRSYDDRGRVSQTPSNEVALVMPYPVAQLAITTDGPVKPGSTSLVRARVLDTQGQPRGKVRVVLSLDAAPPGTTLSVSDAKTDPITGEMVTLLRVPATAAGAGATPSATSTFTPAGEPTSTSGAASSTIASSTSGTASSPATITLRAIAIDYGVSASQDVPIESPATATPTPTATLVVSATPTATTTPTPSPTASVSATPTPTPDLTASPTATPDGTPSPTPVASPGQAATPGTASPTPDPAASPQASATATPSGGTASPGTATPATATPSPIPSATATPAPSPIPTASATPLPTSTPVATATVEPSATATSAPAATATVTVTASPALPSSTPTIPPSPTATLVPSATATSAPTATATAPPTPTSVPTATATTPPTATSVPAATSTSTSTPNATSTPAPTATAAPTSPPAATATPG